MRVLCFSHLFERCGLPGIFLRPENLGAWKETGARFTRDSVVSSLHGLSHFLIVLLSACEA